jgi:PTH1 family peptidyl-tRNA hydrolase
MAHNVDSDTPIKIIVGLGNPEEKYKNTRHNIGYMSVDSLLQYAKEQHKLNVGPSTSDDNWPRQFDALTFPIQPKISGPILLFVKPISGMNSSGISVSGLANYYNVPIEDVIVIHDDIDLPAGKIKAKRGGGNGGHNGLKSIDQYLGPNYNRVRIGIGRPEDKTTPILDYVLGDFKDTDHVWIDNKLNLMSSNLDVLLKNDLENFMKNCS